MPNITVKNIPLELYEQLKASAAANRRSINSEILVCIEKAIGSARLEPETHLRRARILRELTSDYVISDEELADAKNEGRP